jgi:hypothetical protein
MLGRTPLTGPRSLFAFMTVGHRSGKSVDFVAFDGAVVCRWSI